MSGLLEHFTDTKQNMFNGNHYAIPIFSKEEASVVCMGHSLRRTVWFELTHDLGQMLVPYTLRHKGSWGGSIKGTSFVPVVCIF